MPTNGDHPSDSPPEYPMGIPPETEDITEPDLGSSRALLRSLSEQVMKISAVVNDLSTRFSKFEHELALVPKRREQ